MSLSRLENLGANPSGVQLYVDPGNFDATDSIENRGISPNRPFFSIQRAILEASLYSYVLGRNNDRNDKTTIHVASGTHYIDNRPGFSIQNINNTAVFKKRTDKDTWTTTIISPLSETSNFDIFDSNNDLYKFNSIYGGVILPRGTSIIGSDLRKTKIRPLYIPDPLNSNVDRSSILNVTGSCYFSTFTFFDADSTKFSYKDYSDSKHVPKYSHHKLTTFVYADGVNKVRLGLEQTDLTDLEMYYYKVSHAYNTLSGRNIPDYPGSVDFEPSIDEFRIVGALQENSLGISSIRAGNGDGTGDNSIITVTTANLQTKITEPHNFAVDTPIIIKGISVDSTSYNGSFTVREVIDSNTFTYITPSIPQTTVLPQPNTFDIATVSVESDTVSSASPYIFNCSMRSVYGMCGMWADGARADGFKSMVVAQYTGISLQKDDDAYLIYDDKIFYDNIQLSNNPNKANLLPLHQNSRAIYKPEFESFHIRASNDAFIQAVSIFAIGYANHFLTESGADMSITNSNSNFGANALNSIGFRNTSFNRDDVGYITHIIPPQELGQIESDVNWIPIDIEKIKFVGNSTRLYLSGYTKEDVVPDSRIEGYRVGAKLNDKLYLNLDENGIRKTYSASICMTIPSGISNIVSRKLYQVQRTGTVNEITNNILTFTENHQLHNGERIRIFADNGQVPDGLETNRIYYAITSGLNSNQIKIATTLNDALVGTSITDIENNGGVITIISSVTDKKSGDLGHPIQWDQNQSQWYLNVEQSNEIYNKRNEVLNPTPTTFIKRIEDNRLLDDRIYKFRYVIPKEFENAKPPQVGFILQETKNVAIGTEFTEGISLVDSTQLRNNKIIVNATASGVVNNSQIITITTELPHNFIPGDRVKIQNIRSTNNPNATGIVSTYNGEYEVLSIPQSKQFTYRIEGVKINPGTFTNNINQRTTTSQRRALPLVSRSSYKNNFYIYGIDTIQKHSPGETGKDGIYHLKILSASVEINQNVGYGLSQKSFRQDVRNLYPQIDRDNTVSNPNASTSYADLINVGKVITDDKRKSITLEAVNSFNLNSRVGFGITNVIISGVGNTTLTIFTDIEHKLNSIKSTNIINVGSGYSSGTFYSVPLSDGNAFTEDATCQYSASGGNINSSSFRLIDFGSAYTVGQNLTIPGGTSSAIVQVTEINNNVGDGLEIFDFQSSDINGLYEIISVPTKNSVVLHIPSGISTYRANTSGRLPVGYLASKGVAVSTSSPVDLRTGITTITTSLPHGLFVGNKFKFINSNLTSFNKDFVVDSIIGINTFTTNVGIATTTISPTTGKILKYGISSNGLTLGTGEDNLSSRGCFIYAGITTTTTSNLAIDATTVNVSSVAGFKKGDFILIDNEILRINIEPSGNTLSVLRAQLGTTKTLAPSGAILRKIKALPMELRRPSYMRASGHTFEYLGFGPGNYSTALPQRQDRILSEDEILISQARRENGGIVVYTGMNDLGEFYTGSKKSSTITNRETTIDAPVITFTGDDVDGDLEATQSGIFDDIIVRNKILVEGSGSQFFGSVEFKNKLTNHSNQGISVKNLFFKNIDTSTIDKLVSVGSTTSSITNPNSGDIFILDTPTNHIGYTFVDNSWKSWGLVSLSPNELNVTLDRLGIGKTADTNYVLDVSGETQLQDLTVNGTTEFNSNVTFANASFSNLQVNKTATFIGLGTEFTQIHTQGTSKLFNIDVVGTSIFAGISTFNSKVDIDNLVIRNNLNLGVANSNTISAESGNLILSSSSGLVNINKDLSVTSNEVSITTSRASGVATAYITDSRILRLGVGNTNQNSYIDLNNDTNTFSDYGLRLIRNSGIGSQNSSIIHRGSQSLNINAIDSGAEVKILTNNTDRFVVGTSGTITYIQSNSGQNLSGAHFRISQRGSGDASLSWDCAETNLNPTYRWYAGIHTSDGHSWKLSNPLNTVSYGNENYDVDYKLKISRDSTLTLFNSENFGRTLTINQTQFNTSENTFSLFNTNVTTVNAFGVATNLNLGSNTGTITLRNPTLVGTQATQNVYNTVATIVNAFGEATSLILGSTSGITTIRNPTLVGTQATQNVYNTVATTVNAFGVATNLNLGSNTGTITLRNPTLVGTQATQNVYNTIATTVNAFGEATTINLGANTNTSKISINGTTESTNSTNGALVVSGGVGVSGNLSVSGILTAGITTVRSLSINTSGIGIGDIGSDGGSDGVFGIFNTSNNGKISLNAKNSNGVSNETLSVSSSDVNINGNLNVGTAITTPSLRITGCDFVLGSGCNRGNSGNSRALVKDNNATLALNYNGDFSGGVRVDSSLTVVGQFISNVPNGIAPLQVSSATKVDNLNVDFLDGQSGDYYLNYNNLNNRPIISSANAPNTVVLRDDNGGFVAGIITATSFNGELNSTRLDTSSSGVNITGITTINVDSTTSALTITQTNTGNALRINDISSDSDPFIVDQSGRVGIGTVTVTSGYKLDVRGSSIIGGNVQANSFTGKGTIPVGGIIMWSGSIASIPTGWALCNGSNGTPDLRERFIVGAGGDNSTVSGTTGYNPNDTGGANSVTLTVDQMPSHNHTATDSGHTHQLSRTSGNSNVNTQSSRYALATSNDLTTDSTNTGFANVSIGSSGGGQPHENRPPYYALAFIMRVA